MAKKKINKKFKKDPLSIGRPKLDKVEKTVRLGFCVPEGLALRLKEDGKKYGGYGVIVRQAVQMLYDD